MRQSLNNRDFKVHDEVFVKIGDRYVPGTIESYSCTYSAGKWSADYRVTQLEETPPYKLTAYSVHESDGDVFVIHAKDITNHVKDLAKLGTRVTTTVNRIRKDISCSGLTIIDNVNHDTILSGTIVDPGIYKSCSVVMFDESDKYGYLLENMAQEIQSEVGKLNIPNVHKKRFVCTSHTSLSFTDSSSSTQARKNTMSNKIVEMVKGDAKEAAYRVAGTQITNGVKLGVIKLFESKGGKSDQMAMLKEVLDSEVGDSLISLLLGFGLNYAPGIKDDPRVKKLSEEFRINGMSVAGNAIMGAAMESFLPVLTGALQALPAEEASKPRIAESSEEEEEEETAPPAKKQKRA